MNLLAKTKRRTIWTTNFSWEEIFPILNRETLVLRRGSGGKIRIINGFFDYKVDVKMERKVRTKFLKDNLKELHTNKEQHFNKTVEPYLSSPACILRKWLIRESHTVFCDTII